MNNYNHRLNNMSKDCRIQNIKVNDYLRKYAKNYTIKELIPILYNEFGRIYKRPTLEKLLHRHNIEYKKTRKQFDIQKLNYLKSISKNHNAKELYEISKSKFNETYSFQKFQNYLIRNKVPYRLISENKRLARQIGELPLGSQFTCYGQARIKINKNQWITKQRYIYQNYHNVKLNHNEYVIFLDNDRTNFDIDNLKVVDVRVAGLLKNLKGYNKEITELGINIAELRIKTIDIEKGVEIV